MSKLERIRSTLQRVSVDRYTRIGFTVERILNLLKENTLSKIVTSVWVLKLEGIEKPTLPQVAKNGGIGIGTVKNNSELVNKVRSVFDLFNNYTKISAHTIVDQSDGESGTVSSSGIDIGDTVFMNELSALGVHFYDGSFIFEYDGSSVVLPIAKESLQPIEKICVGLGLPLTSQTLALECTGIKMKEYLCALTTIALRELKVLRGSQSLYNQIAFGEHYFNFYVNVISGNGRISSKNKHRDWFYRQDNNIIINKLLQKDPSYQVDAFHMKFKPTDLGNSVMQKVLEYFKLIEYTSNTVIYDECKHILFKKELLDKIKFQDAMILLSNTVGFAEDSFIVDLNKIDTCTDRVYSVFTSISSETRESLGYINYDIGAALQTIALRLIPEENQDLYPLHKELVDNKHSFRSKVMKETGKSHEWVKEELPKLDNMDRYTTKSETLKEYFLEAECLRDDVLQYQKKVNYETYNKAHLRAKNAIEKIWNDEIGKYDFIPTEEKKESSVFFFLWTQFERDIREAMKLPFTNRDTVIDVHDAVYSKEVINFTLLEQVVLEQTGFEVNISS